MPRSATEVDPVESIFQSSSHLTCHPLPVYIYIARKSGRLGYAMRRYSYDKTDSGLGQYSNNR
jgi:hypothetical protein